MSIQRDKLLQKFSEEYDSLNPQQKQAVDKIFGPVMVIAGPGTGKTQILSVRIGKILLDTD
jgi:DNA helicase II / ATP-dependent DNA helicase PcrA